MSLRIEKINLIFRNIKLKSRNERENHIKLLATKTNFTSNEIYNSIKFTQWGMRRQDVLKIIKSVRNYRKQNL